MGDPTQDVFNPSTGEVSKQVAVATKTTVEKTITQRWLSSSIREGINFSFPS
jgi:acyl-CoA reductase-like NAD-dependent aldehyde dehydrogenase